MEDPILQVRSYVVEHRGASREALLSEVRASLERGPMAVLGPLLVLHFRELDGDVILRRAEKALASAGHDPVPLRLLLARYRQRHADPLGGRSAPG